MRGRRKARRLLASIAAGRILPNSFAGGGGGMVVNQTNSYDLRGTDISRAELDQKIEQANRRTFQAVFQAAGRGGGYSREVGRRPK